MRLRVAFGIVACAALLPACGASRSIGYHNPHYPYGAPNVPASLSKCMRANGVSGFPDPREGPNGGGVGFPGGLGVSSDGTLIVMGQRLAGPAFKHAEQVCKEYLPPGSPPPQITAERQRQELAFARCMRTHGVPNFPDPSGSGGIGQRTAAAIDTQSPAYRQAAMVCGGA